METPVSELAILYCLHHELVSRETKGSCQRVQGHEFHNVHCPITVDSCVDK